MLKFCEMYGEVVGSKQHLTTAIHQSQHYKVR